MTGSLKIEGINQFQRSITIHPKKSARAAASATPPMDIAMIARIEKWRLPSQSAKGFFT
jgi:hypothetical protein